MSAERDDLTIRAEIMQELFIQQCDAAFMRGMEQARCRECGAPLVGLSEKHAEGCGYPAERGRLMQDARAGEREETGG